jgi:acetyl-CoA C-acetyltransferase
MALLFFFCLYLGKAYLSLSFQPNQNHFPDMKQAYIVAAVRTPMGSFGGVFAGLSATELGATAIKGALAAINLDPTLVQEVYMGNVVSANLGQAPARQAALGAGLLPTTVCTTVNKVCSSGAKSIMLAAQSIMLGINEIVVAGGMESMSNAPYMMPKGRFGYKYGHAELVDSLAKDGLDDAYQKKAMGVFADATAVKYGITREDQDAYTIRSYKMAAQATANGTFKNEIVPVAVPQRKGDPLMVAEDEEYKNVFFDKIPTLKPAFTPNGTVTAANASTINDGAAALVVMSKEKVDELGIKPLARIVSFADAEHEPEWFTTAPTKAVPKALERAGLKKEDIAFYEVNEAFAVVPLAFEKELDINPELVNIHGGAVSLGHPLGCSGARISTHMIHLLQQKQAQFGAIGICNGGGGASAIVFERVG